MKIISSRKWIPCLGISLFVVASSGCATVLSDRLPAAKSRGQWTLPQYQGTADGAGSIETIWLQINDVYEVLPLDNGKSGGLARVAALEKILLAQNSNTRTVIAGDFFNPSALNAAKVEGTALNGKQMVDTLNAFLDLAAFGNHEFDLKEADFRSRMKESKFHWVASNAFDARTGSSFEGAPPTRVYDFSDSEGDQVRIGVFSVMVDSTVKDYVKYSNWLTAAQKAVQQLRQVDRVDAVIALTHLSLEEDRQLLQKVSGIDILMGGHEHEQMRVAVLNPQGKTVEIFKADANAKTAWVHALRWDSRQKKLSLSSTIHEIGDFSPEDPAVKERVQGWVERAYQGFRSQGFEPTREVVPLTRALDGRSSVVRSQRTGLTEVISESILRAFGDSAAEISLFNSGLIRIDDVVSAGVLTEYDILRIAPYEDKLLLVKIQGKDLRSILEYSEKNRGDGMYLHSYPLPGESFAQIESTRMYRVALNSYLFGRIEEGLGNPLSTSERAVGWKPFSEILTGDELRSNLVRFLRK